MSTWFYTLISKSIKYKSRSFVEYISSFCNFTGMANGNFCCGRQKLAHLILILINNQMHRKKKTQVSNKIKIICGHIDANGERKWNSLWLFQINGDFEVQQLILKNNKFSIPHCNTIYQKYSISILLWFHIH